MKNEISSDQQIKISVVIVVFNHCRTIERALNSVFSQKVDATVEILIGDDASTDGTQQILKKYSDHARLFLRSTNVGATRNLYELLMKCRGEYVTLLEGDDYWIDEYKLRKQLDFLEKDSRYIAVGHNRNIVDEKGIFLGKQLEDRSCDTVVTWKNYIYKEKTIVLMSLLFKNIYKNSAGKYSIQYKFDRMLEDVSMTTFLFQCGDIYNIGECMGVYEKKCRVGMSNYRSIFSRSEQFQKYMNVTSSLEGWLSQENVFRYLQIRNAYSLLSYYISHRCFKETITVLKILGKRKKFLVFYFPKVFVTTIMKRISMLK